MKTLKRSARSSFLLAWLGSLFLLLCGDKFQTFCTSALTSKLQAGGTDIPSAARIFSAAREAMGGVEAVQAIQSVEALADCQGPRSKYRTEIISALPDRLFFRQTWPNREPFVAVINGKYAWTRDEKSGAVSTMNQNSREMVRGHEFQMIAIAPASRYTNPVVEGYEDFAGARRLKIRATDGIGNTSYLFFDVTSHLMAGVIVANPSSPDEQVRIVFNAWKQVGKVKLPSQITATDKSGDFVFEFKEINLNRLDANMFKVPENIASKTK